MDKNNQGAIFIASFSEQLIREKVMMDEPDQYNYFEYNPIHPGNPEKMGFDIDKFNEDCKVYDEHVASRRTFPYDVKEEQDGNELREGKDFEFGCDNGEPCLCNSFAECKKPIAIPVEVLNNEKHSPIEPEKNDKIIFKAARDYLLTPTHKKLLVWKEIGYRENFNPKLSIEQNDKEFFKWIVDNKKRPEFVKIFGYHLEKHSPIEPDTHLRTKDKLVKKGEAGYEWLNYIKQFSKLDELWNQLPNVPNVWLSQQIDIFAGKYPSKPEPDTPLKDENSFWDRNLLPCPFCGGMPEWVNLAHPSGIPALQCPECQFKMQEDRRDKTVFYWNRRTSLQPVKESAMGWLKKEGYPDVMPMTLDNLGIILDRYKPSSKEQEGVCSHCGDPIENPLCRNCETALTLPDN